MIPDQMRYNAEHIHTQLPDEAEVFAIHTLSGSAQQRLTTNSLTALCRIVDGG